MNAGELLFWRDRLLEIAGDHERAAEEQLQKWRRKLPST